MPITISCVHCGGDFKIPDALFASRFAGKETPIKCRKCGERIIVDGSRVSRPPARTTMTPRRRSLAPKRASLPPDDDRPSASPTLPPPAPMVASEEERPTVPAPITDVPDEARSSLVLANAVQVNAETGVRLDVALAPPAAPLSSSSSLRAVTLSEAPLTPSQREGQSAAPSDGEVEATPKTRARQRGLGVKLGLAAALTLVTVWATAVLRSNGATGAAPAAGSPRIEPRSRAAAAPPSGIANPASVGVARQGEIAAADVSARSEASAVTSDAAATSPSQVADAPQNDVRGAAPAGSVAYDAQALAFSLRYAFARAEDCHRAGRPSGTAHATLRFGPSGKVLDAKLEGEPIASAAVGKCILSFLRSALIPPYQGEEFVVERDITLR